MGLARVYLDVNMSLSFVGLMNILSEDKIRIRNEDRKFYLFINRKRTAFKMLVNGSYMVYHRDTKPFPLEAVQFFPHFFDGKNIDVEGAVTKFIKSKVETPKGTSGRMAFRDLVKPRHEIHA